MSGPITHALVFTLVSLLLVACGGGEGAAPKAGAPQRMETPDPRTVDEAQDQIARLSAELGGAPAKKADAPKSDAPPQPAPPAAESTAGATSKPATGADHDRLYVSACASPCRALASMRRAVDALCRMTGDADNRCVDAKKTLADSALRTASCKCE